MNRTAKKIIKIFFSNRTISRMFWGGYKISPKYRTFILNFNEMSNKYCKCNANEEWFYLFRFYEIKYGFSVEDFFLYRLFEKTEHQVDAYISKGRRSELFDYADDKNYRHIMASKEDFYKVYRDFMQQDCMFVSTSNQKEEFVDFCNNKKCIIAKPVDGQKGIGVIKLYTTTHEEIETAWTIVLQKQMLVERVLENCDELKRFHPESINTVRISTVIGTDGQINVMASTFRTGVAKECVDNGSHGGIFAAIDIDKGIICSNGFNILGEEFVKHPDTGCEFKGTIIPKWNGLLSLVKKIAFRTPELRYIGWDFVLTENYEWLLLEGNEPGGVNIHQIPLNRGLYYEYSDVVYGKLK